MKFLRNRASGAQPYSLPHCANLWFPGHLGWEPVSLPWLTHVVHFTSECLSTFLSYLCVSLMLQLKHCLFREPSLTLPSCYPETFTLSGVFHFYFPRSPPLSLWTATSYFFSCFCSSQGSFWGFPGDTSLSVQETQEAWVRSLDWEGLLEKGTATHSSIPFWRIQWTEEPGGLQSMGCRVRHYWSNFARMHTRSCSGLPPVSV